MLATLVFGVGIGVLGTLATQAVRDWVRTRQEARQEAAYLAFLASIGDGAPSSVFLSCPSLDALPSVCLPPIPTVRVRMFA